MSSLYTYDLALSNQTGFSFLEQCHAGAESCQLTKDVDLKNTNKKVVKVNFTTLDRIVEQYNIFRKIDVLKIDTEGFDPLVIQGAENILNRHQIRLFVFEYHGVGMWQTTTLHEVIVNLDRKNYLCYQLGETGIFRLTGCWSSHFEIKWWSNVLCVSKYERRLISFIEKLLIKV